MDAIPENRLTARQACLLVETPLGPLRLEASHRGLTGCRFVENSEEVSLPSPSGPPSHLLEAALLVKRYFINPQVDLGSIPVDVSGTPFQLRVWKALRLIPPGTTMTYGAIASLIGHGGAFRAVGQANHKNRILLFVPCHRVVAAAGQVHGFAAGIWRKEWLLAHEGRRRLPGSSHPTKSKSGPAKRQPVNTPVAT